MSEQPVGQEILDAQQRLSQTCLKMPMNPNQAAIASFINSQLMRAQLDALVILATKTELTEYKTPAEAYQAYLLQALTEKADALQAQIDLAPRLIHSAGHG